MQSPLQSVLVLLATAVLVVVVFRSLKLPPLLGYLIVGVAIGPHALAWIPDTAGGGQLGGVAGGIDTGRGPGNVLHRDTRQAARGATRAQLAPWPADHRHPARPGSRGG